MSPMSRSVIRNRRVACAKLEAATMFSAPGAASGPSMAAAAIAAAMTVFPFRRAMDAATSPSESNSFNTRCCQGSTRMGSPTAGPLRHPEPGHVGSQPLGE